MATVSVQAVGGKLQLVEGVSTIAEVKAKLGLANYAASINGEPSEDGEALEDGNFVTLAPQVKGA